MAIDTTGNFQKFGTKFIKNTFKSKLDFIPEKIMSEKDKVFLVHSITGNKEFYASLNNEELKAAQNLAKWFSSELKDRSYSHQEGLIISEGDEMLMKKHNNLEDPNVIFEKLRVMIIGNLLRDYLSTGGRYKNLNIRNASTYDRMKGQIDYIMSFEETEGKKSYLGVTSTIIPVEMIDERIEGRKDTFCIEYQNAFESGKFMMPRLLFYVEANILYRMLGSYHEKIKDSGEIGAFDTYSFMEDAIKKEYISKQTVEYTISSISKRLDNLGVKF